MIPPRDMLRGQTRVRFWSIVFVAVSSSPVTASVNSSAIQPATNYSAAPRQRPSGFSRSQKLETSWSYRAYIVNQSKWLAEYASPPAKKLSKLSNFPCFHDEHFKGYERNFANMQLFSRLGGGAFDYGAPNPLFFALALSCRCGLGGPLSNDPTPTIRASHAQSQRVRIPICFGHLPDDGSCRTALLKNSLVVPGSCSPLGFYRRRALPFRTVIYGITDKNPANPHRVLIPDARESNSNPNLTCQNLGPFL